MHGEADCSTTSRGTGLDTHGSSACSANTQTNGSSTGQRSDNRGHSLPRAVNDAIHKRAVLRDQCRAQLLVLVLAEHARGKLTHSRASSGGASHLSQRTSTTNDTLSRLSCAQTKKLANTTALGQRRQVAAVRRCRQRDPAFTLRCSGRGGLCRLQCGAHISGSKRLITSEHLVRGLVKVGRSSLRLRRFDPLGGLYGVLAGDITPEPHKVVCLCALQIADTHPGGRVTSKRGTGDTKPHPHRPVCRTSGESLSHVCLP